MRFSSKLFPLLFHNIDEHRKLHVLDLGSASAETVRFFSEYRCKLFFQDFLNEPGIPVCDADITDSELIQAYADFFSFQSDILEGNTFDICLFWDFFSRLDTRAMHAFGEALKPYIGKHTLAHGFGVLNSKTTLEVMDYRIESAEFLVSQSIISPQKRLYHHPQRDFESQLPDFTVTRGTLLQNGKLELLLEAKASD